LERSNLIFLLSTFFVLFSNLLYYIILLLYLLIESLSSCFFDKSMFRLDSFFCRKHWVTRNYTSVFAKLFYVWRSSNKSQKQFFVQILIQFEPWCTLYILNMKPIIYSYFKSHQNKTEAKIIKMLTWFVTKIEKICGRNIQSFSVYRLLLNSIIFPRFNIKKINCYSCTHIKHSIKI
jgi:hypothetical protein